MSEITETEALAKMKAYCASAEHCRAELTEKMQRWGLAYDTVNRIVTQLEHENFIDEERYCRAFINDKYRFAKWGKVKIAQALHLKKIPPYVYSLMLNNIDEEEYLGILRRLLEAKRKSVRATDAYEQNGKLVRFALSRGFEMKDIRRCMDVPEEAGENEPAGENY